MDFVLTAALVLPWAATALLGCLLFVALRQYGHALVRQDEFGGRISQLEHALHDLAVQVASARSTVADPHAGHDHSAPAAGLTLGSQAPAFALRDLSGRERTLDDLLGQPTLMVFFNPECGFCRQLAPQLGKLTLEGPRVLVVGQGDAKAYGRMAEEYGWRCEVVLDPAGEVTLAYRITGTPTGYLLDSHGRVASSLAVGADALLGLLSPTAALNAPAIEARNGHAGGSAALPARPAAAAPAAMLISEGLAVGTPLPALSLPDLDGKLHAVSEFRGKRLLLVLVEPGAVACQRLVKDLARRRRPRDVEVVLVSRGEPEANREWSREHGLNAPVLLQRNWEFSRAAGTFATPAAYVLDEAGRVAREVALGPEAVLRVPEAGVVR